MKQISFLIGIALCFLIANSGCSLHQVESPDPGELPGTFSETPNQPQETVFNGKWWKTFNDPQLTKLIEISLTNNLDIAQAVARFEQAQAMFRRTKSGDKPFLNFDGQVSRDSQPGMSGTSTSNNYRLSLAAGYEIDLWQKVQSLSDAARAETLASREAIKSIYISISANVADLYFLAGSLGNQLDLIDKTISSFSDTEQLILNRYNDGLLSSQDLYQARTNLASAQIRKTELKANLANTEHSLTVLMGRFPAGDYSSNKFSLAEIPDAFPTGIPSDILTLRPDIQAAKLAVIAKDESIGAAIANRFPSINLLASYGRTNNPITDTFWSLFAGLTQPILDGGNRRAELDRSKAALKEALAYYQQTVLQAVKEVEDSLVNNRETEVKVRLTKKQRELAHSTLQLTEANYQDGIIDYLAVLTAQRNLLEMEAQLTETKRLLISHRISLARALGGSWTEEYLQAENK